MVSRGKKRIIITIDEYLVKELNGYAIQLGMTMSQICNKMLKEGLDVWCSLSLEEIVGY